MLILVKPVEGLFGCGISNSEGEVFVTAMLVVGVFNVNSKQIKLYNAHIELSAYSLGDTAASLSFNILIFT